LFFFLQYKTYRPFKKHFLNRQSDAANFNENF
jgi:hypothetical protein